MRVETREGTHGAGCRALLVLAVAALLCWTPAGTAAASDPVAEGLLPASALATLEKALDFYEEMRVDLAGDNLDGIPSIAVRLAGGLRLSLAGDEVPGKIHSMIEEAALTAESMMDVEDLASARIAFGDVSRLILQIAADDPRLVEGWHVFGCPMAVGFEKWIEPTEDFENPYMGQSMLKCGGASDWRVASYAFVDPDTPVKMPQVSRAPVDEPEWKPASPGSAWKTSVTTSSCGVRSRSFRHGNAATD